MYGVRWSRMGDGTDNAYHSAQIEKACRVYTGLGFSDLRIAAQLIRSGYPPDLVAARFPQIPADTLPAPPTSRTFNRAHKPSSRSATPIADVLSSRALTSSRPISLVAAPVAVE